MNIAEEGPRRCVVRAEVQDEVGEHGVIRNGLQTRVREKRPRAGCEDHRVAHARVTQRTHPEPVARKQKPVQPVIADAGDELALEAFGKRLAERVVGRQHEALIRTLGTDERMIG